MDDTRGDAPKARAATPKPGDQSRADRLAAQLRANLIRRKARARAEVQPAEHPPEVAED